MRAAVTDASDSIRQGRAAASAAATVARATTTMSSVQAVHGNGQIAALRA
jgi:hypothetical protein